jgi:hypothetical protein
VTTALRFRNLTASPDDPVETWPFEGILAAVERGSLPDWRRLAKVIQADPWGAVAQQVLEAVRLARPYGTAELLEGVVDRARNLAADSERSEVAAEVQISRANGRRGGISILPALPASVRGLMRLLRSASWPS